MYYNQCKWLAINTIGLRMHMNFLQLDWEFQFLANIRSMFLIFVKTYERRRLLESEYECLAIAIRSLRMSGKWHSYVNRKDIRHSVRAVLGLYLWYFVYSWWRSHSFWMASDETFILHMCVSRLWQAFSTGTNIFDLVWHTFQLFNTAWP